MNPVAAAEWAVRLIGTGMGKRHHPGPTATLLSDEDLKLDVDRLLGLQPSRRSYFAKAAPDESDEERDEERDVDGAGEEGPATAAIRARARARHRRADEADTDADADVRGAEATEHWFTEGDEPGDGELEKVKLRAQAGDVDARLLLAALGRDAVRQCLATPRRTDPSAAAFHALLWRSR